MEEEVNGGIFSDVDSEGCASSKQQVAYSCKWSVCVLSPRYVR